MIAPVGDQEDGLALLGVNDAQPAGVVELDMREKVDLVVWFDDANAARASLCFMREDDAVIVDDDGENSPTWKKRANLRATRHGDAGLVFEAGDKHLSLGAVTPGGCARDRALKLHS